MVCRSVVSRGAAGRLLLAVAFSLAPAGAQTAVEQSARSIPVAHEVDVVVVGGSTGAVAAAVAAAEKGAKVFLAAPKTYLGEDMCATLRLWLEKDETPAHPLARKVFSDWEGLGGGGITRDPVRPMHVKKTLDDALLAARVPYLFGSYVTDILRDGKGQPAGVVIANRAGRQAVLAKVIIDATPRAWVARMAGAKFQPYPKGTQRFTRYVVGGELKAGRGVTARRLDLAYLGDGTLKARTGPDETKLPLVEYQIEIPMPDGDFESFARAEQTARDLSFDPGQKAAAEEMFQVPPDPVRPLRASSGAWKDARSVPLDALRPAGVPRLYLLNGCAGVSRAQATAMLRPPALMEMGARIGEAAAAEALNVTGSQEARVAVQSARAASGGDVKELLGGARPTDRELKTVASPAGSLPVLGSYDVVVVGGGTGGAPAGIGAARSGARTLVVEYLDGLGGVGTMGRISRYYWGYRGGFTKEAPGGGSGGSKDSPRFEWDPLHRSDWYRREIRRAGGEVWYGVLGAGAYVDGRQVKGVVVATPQGRGVLLAKVVIDSTGNADIAAAAGAETVTTGVSEIAVQGTGLPSINLGSGYTNTDFTITDETDAIDIWHTLVYAKSKYSTQFDLGQLIDSRERRRIVGEFEMNILDQMLNRSYPDTLAVAYSNFDTHGYTVDTYFLLHHPEKKGVTVDLPYRCFLPKRLDGLLVTGLGISVHRDAVPLIRMQPDVQNHGYAMGMAAAAAVSERKALRKIDLPKLQKRLVEMEIAPERVLSDKDSFPPSEDKLAQAIRDYPRETHSAAVILTQPEAASPLLRKAYAEAAAKEDKLAYALLLATLGDSTGIDTLIEALDSQGWDAGWRYTGMGQFGGALSTVDRYIVALGRTRDPRAVPAILRKVAELTPDSEFSHHRAVALALETVGDARAAGPLAVLLAKPEMAGWAVHDVEKAARMTGLNVNETHTRGLSLRELALARALLRCGDQDGIGRRILAEYGKDLRGHLARHAQAILDEARARGQR